MDEGKKWEYTEEQKERAGQFQKGFGGEKTAVDKFIDKYFRGGDEAEATEMQRTNSEKKNVNRKVGGFPG